MPAGGGQALGKLFGKLEMPLSRDQRAEVRPEITRLSNKDENGNLMSVKDKHSIFMKRKLLWPSDSSFKPMPSKYSILADNEVSFSGGETEFANVRVCYDDWKVG